MRHAAAILLLLIAIADPSAIAAGLNHDCCPEGTCFCRLISSDGAGCSREARAGCSIDASNGESAPLPEGSSGVQHQRLLPKSVILSPVPRWVGAVLANPESSGPPVLLPPTPPPRTSRLV